MVSLGIHGARGMNPIRYIYVPQMSSNNYSESINHIFTLCSTLFVLVHTVKIKYFPSSLLNLDSKKYYTVYTVK